MSREPTQAERDLAEKLAQAMTRATGVPYRVFSGYPECPLCGKSLRTVPCDGRLLLQCSDFYCDFETDVTPDSP